MRDQSIGLAVAGGESGGFVDDGPLRCLFSLLLRHGLIHQHYGYVVTNGVDALAIRALQSAAIRLDFDFDLADRAGEYLQQFLTDGHAHLLFRSEV
jgi:hypothetical protein